MPRGYRLEVLQPVGAAAGGRLRAVHHEDLHLAQVRQGSRRQRVGHLGEFRLQPRQHGLRQLQCLIGQLLLDEHGPTVQFAGYVIPRRVVEVDGRLLQRRRRLAVGARRLLGS